MRDIGDARVQLEELLSGQTDAVAPTSREARGRFARFVSAASLLVALGAATAAVIVSRRPVAEWPLTQLELNTPPTPDPFSFALSPDGRQIVFVAMGEKASQLWLRPLGQANAQPLAGTEGATAPFWSPDGHDLGFFADAKLKRIDLTGGAPQVLVDAMLGRGGTWSRDDVIVYGTGASSGVMRVAAKGGTPTAVTHLTSGQVGHRWPHFLPDGRRFLFFATGPPAVAGVYMASLDAGEATLVLATDSAAEYAPPGYLLALSQGMLMAHLFDAARGVVTGNPVSIAAAVAMDQGNFRGGFTVSATGVLAYHHAGAGRRQLMWTDHSGQPRGVLLPPEETGLSYVELAPDGQHVAVLRNVQGNQDIWLIEVARSLPTRITTDPALAGSPLWSPDGRYLVFRSNRRGKWDLFQKLATGDGQDEPLLVTSEDKAPLSWSTDGRFLLYAVQGTQSDLWALPLFGEGKSFPVVQTSFDDVQGQFSPDGRWLAYVSNETGHYEVYVQPFPGPGAKRRVSTNGGITPRWRRDGLELFYVAPDNRMMAASLQITADGSTLGSGAPVALFPTHLTAGNTGTAGAFSRPQYAVGADGGFLLNVTADDAASPMAIIQNWMALLTK